MIKLFYCQPELVEGGLNFSKLSFLTRTAFDKLRLTTFIFKFLHFINPKFFLLMVRNKWHLQTKYIILLILLKIISRAFLKDVLFQIMILDATGLPGDLLL